MKKIILTAAAVFAFGFANAQDAAPVKEASTFGFSQGNIMLEGNLSFSRHAEKNEPTTSVSTVSFNPKVGYFIADKFAVGIELGIGSTNKAAQDTPDQTTSSFDAGVFARYYFLNLGERFKTYTELGLGMTSSKEDEAHDSVKTNGFNIGLGLGMNYFLTPKMAISFGLSDVLGYSTSKTNADVAPDTADKGHDDFNVNLNVFNNFFNTPTFGLLYKF